MTPDLSYKREGAGGVGQICYSCRWDRHVIYGGGLFCELADACSYIHNEEEGKHTQTHTKESALTCRGSKMAIRPRRTRVLDPHLHEERVHPLLGLALVVDQHEGLPQHLAQRLLLLLLLSQDGKHRVGKKEI